MPFRVAELLATGEQGSGRELIAKAAEVDAKTLRTFLDGGRVSPESLIAIIVKGLGLVVSEIAKPAETEHVA